MPYAFVHVHVCTCVHVDVHVCSVWVWPGLATMAYTCFVHMCILYVHVNDTCTCTTVYDIKTLFQI